MLCTLLCMGRSALASPLLAPLLLFLAAAGNRIFCAARRLWSPRASASQRRRLAEASGACGPEGWRALRRWPAQALRNLWVGPRRRCP